LLSRGLRKDITEVIKEVRFLFSRIFFLALKTVLLISFCTSWSQFIYLFIYLHYSTWVLLKSAFPLTLKRSISNFIVLIVGFHVQLYSIMPKTFLKAASNETKN